MGCGASIPVQDEQDPFLQDKQINDAIEQSLHLNKANAKNGVKLLLLGAGESGKSTVLKQLKLLHKGGFSHQERMQYSNIIWCDVIQSMKILIIQARKLKIRLDCDQPNSALIPFKRCVLRSDALTQIDTSIAGGTNFLNDYILKYDEKIKMKRKLNSTGVVGFLGDPGQKETTLVPITMRLTPKSETKFCQVSHKLLLVAVTTMVMNSLVTRATILLNQYINCGPMIPVSRNVLNDQMSFNLRAALSTTLTMSSTLLTLVTCVLTWTF